MVAAATAGLAGVTVWSVLKNHEQDRERQRYLVKPSLTLHGTRVFSGQTTDPTRLRVRNNDLGSARHLRWDILCGKDYIACAKETYLAICAVGEEKDLSGKKDHSLEHGDIIFLYYTDPIGYTYRAMFRRYNNEWVLDLEELVESLPPPLPPQTGL